MHPVDQPNRYFPLPGEGLRSIMRNLIVHANRSDRVGQNAAYVAIDGVTVRCVPDNKQCNVEILLLKYFEQQEARRRLQAQLDADHQFRVLDLEAAWNRIDNAGSERAQARAAVEIADRWAELMEQKHPTAGPLGDIIAEAYHEANVFALEDWWIYNFAVRTLVSSWRLQPHKKEFLRWHATQEQKPEAHHEATGSYTRYTPRLIVERWG